MLVVIFGAAIALAALQVTATDDQCTRYQFKAPFIPGDSCENIYNMNPESHDRPGYYWIFDSNGPIQVYCGMNYTGSSCEDIYNNNPETGEHSGYYRINGTQFTYCNLTAIADAAAGIISTCAGRGGGWRRIVSIDISAGDDCPTGWRKANNSGVSFCRVDGDSPQTCSSASFSANGTSYRNVCGRARGYQKGITFAFRFSSTSSLDAPYVSGLSITYGTSRQHIWTYATGRYDNTQSFSEASFICPCANTGGQSGPSSPSYVGTNYHCESGTENRVSSDEYYLNDVLWDGLGCTNSSCCNRNVGQHSQQPWFYYQLNMPTSDDIEARICDSGSFALSSTLIDQLEIYIQ